MLGKAQFIITPRETGINNQSEPPQRNDKKSVIYDNERNDEETFTNVVDNLTTRNGPNCREKALETLAATT